MVLTREKKKKRKRTTVPEGNNNLFSSFLFPSNFTNTSMTRVRPVVHSPSVFRDDHFVGQALELGPQVSVLERQGESQSLVPGDGHGAEILPGNHRPLVAPLLVIVLGSGATLPPDAVPLPSAILVRFSLAITLATGGPCRRARFHRCWLHLLRGTLRDRRERERESSHDLLRENCRHCFSPKVDQDSQTRERERERDERQKLEILRDFPPTKLTIARG